MNIYEKGASYGSVPMYVVTGEKKTLYKCVSSGGFVVYKEAREMHPNDDDDDRLAFIVGAQTAINEARAEVTEAQKLLELAQSEQE